MDNMITLFKCYAEQSTPPIIELQNINHKPVGVLYLKDMRYKDIKVSETNNTERYFLLIDGIGIFFSYWQKHY